jgi:hypothetical protein
VVFDCGREVTLSVLDADHASCAIIVRFPFGTKRVSIFASIALGDDFVGKGVRPAGDVALFPQTLMSEESEKSVLSCPGRQAESPNAETALPPPGMSARA